MDKELFRLILLVLGVTLVATVYYWDRLRGLFGPRSKPRPRQAAARREAAAPPAAESRQEPTVAITRPAEEQESLDHDLVELEALIRSDGLPDVLLDDIPPTDPGDDGGVVRQQTPTDPDPEPAPPPRVLALTLIATSGSISGIRLRRVLTDHGLGLGSRGLFERIGEEGRALYCAANLVEPGTFDPVTLDGVSTPGVVLFQVLDGPGDHLAVLETMLETAERLADRLDCTLCDVRRERLGTDAIAALRTEAEQAGGQALP